MAEAEKTYEGHAERMSKVTSQRVFLYPVVNAL
jgi:hypothetical protein